MATKTQYSPNAKHNAELLAAGGSKTVYALVTPEIETVKEEMLGSQGGAARAEYLEQFRDAWTCKQDAAHQDFFNKWIAWSAPIVDLDPGLWSFQYPTAGASEGLRHLIYEHAVNTKGKGDIHVFAGEYEGYKAIAEACGITCVEHKRRDMNQADLEEFAKGFGKKSLFFISQPSAIDGNVWKLFNFFTDLMPANSIVADVTYVGAVCQNAITEQFNLNADSIRNVVFSLSKPFGVYYDRIGGVFCRSESAGLFGNKWFKNLTSLQFGTSLMEAFDVFELPQRLRPVQKKAASTVADALGFQLRPSDVVILAIGNNSYGSTRLAKYVFRAENLRVCLTPEMSRLVRENAK